MDLALDLDLDLDLNQEAESPESLHAEMGDNYERIEERIRLLESVVARARFRPPLQSYSTSTTPSPISIINTSQSDVPPNIPKPQPGSINPGKIDGGIHLIAEALAMDSTCEENSPSTSASTSAIQRKPGGSIYDCNICFSVSKDPVVTCCGHLFCWPCFFTLPNTDSYSSKECPVCQGEVSETGITPIYGASSSFDTLTPSSSNSHPVKIPPRPRAHRIDSVRQRLGYPPLPPNQRVNQIFVHPNLHQPAGPLGETLADHLNFFVNRQQLPRTQTQPPPPLPPPFHSGDVGDPIFHGFIPLVETATSSGNVNTGNQVADGSNETAVSGSSSSRRRGSNAVGVTVRGRRRRRRRD